MVVAFYIAMFVIGGFLGATVIAGAWTDPPSMKERFFAGFFIGTLWVLIPLMVAGLDSTPSRPSNPTTTTIPNTDPTKDWVYENGLYFRCEGPNMVYDGAHENAAVKDDPRCVAAFEGGAR